LPTIHTCTIDIPKDAADVIVFLAPWRAWKKSGDLGCRVFGPRALHLFSNLCSVVLGRRKAMKPKPASWVK
jgi:hypothetical protein